MQTVSRDDVFEVLGNQRRRCVLHYLLGIDDAATVDTLARQIAAWEYGQAVEQVTSRQRKRVYTALRQTHLPKMSSAGVIAYDSDRGTVQLTEQGRALKLYLEADTPDLPWNVYYLAVGSLGIAAVALAAAGVPLFSAIPGLGWAALVALIVVLSAVVQVFDQRRETVGRDAALADLDSSGASGSPVSPDD